MACSPQASLIRASPARIAAISGPEKNQMLIAGPSKIRPISVLLALSSARTQPGVRAQTAGSM